MFDIFLSNFISLFFLMVLGISPCFSGYITAVFNIYALLEFNALVIIFVTGFEWFRVFSLCEFMFLLLLLSYLMELKISIALSIYDNIIMFIINIVFLKKHLFRQHCTFLVSLPVIRQYDITSGLSRVQKYRKAIFFYLYTKQK